MKEALITGATSGIGEGLAKALAEKGYSLILSGRNQDKLNELKNSLKVPVTIVPCDLAETSEPLVKIIQERAPDLVINNAGFGQYGKAINYPTKDQTDIVKVNCLELLALTLEAGKALKQAGKPGTILNISSAGGFQPFPYFAVYVASKAFVTSLTTSLHEELASSHIRVLAACPGIVRTNFSVRASPKHEKKERPGTMSLEYAVNRIMKQLETGKTIDIFDWRYKLMVYAGRMTPDWIICKFLKNALKGEY